MPNETTPSYVELASQTYTLITETAAQSHQQALGYGKALYEILSRPYASTAVETAVRENFDRANQVVSLTVSELQKAGQKQAELAEKLASHTAKVQDSALCSARGLWKTGVSNLNYVKETTNAQIDHIAKRVEDIQARTADLKPPAATTSGSKN